MAGRGSRVDPSRSPDRTSGAISPRTAGRISSGVNEPCMPIRVSSRGNCAGHHGPVGAHGDQHVSPALGQRRRRPGRTSLRRSPPRGSGPRPGRRAGRPSARRHRGRSIAVDVELAEPALTGQRIHPGHQRGMVLEQDLLAARHVDHAVVAGDDQRRRRRAGRRAAVRSSASIRLQLRPAIPPTRSPGRDPRGRVRARTRRPGVRRAEVAAATVSSIRRSSSDSDPNGDELRAPQGRLGQPGALEAFEGRPTAPGRPASVSRSKNVGLAW